MNDADLPGDGTTVGPAMPQMPEVKPFTVGKTSKKSAMPRAEPLEEPIAAAPTSTAAPVPAPGSILTMLPNNLAVAAGANNNSDTGGESLFTNLVRADGDIVGLVAYSIHKQNEHDWLQAFTKANNRPPDAAEMAAYLLGELTSRRLATYRHLAAATLAGKGPEMPAGDNGEAYLPPSQFTAARYAPPQARSESRVSRGGTIAAYIALAVVVVVAVLLAARYGLPGIGGH